MQDQCPTSGYRGRVAARRGSVSGRAGMAAPGLPATNRIRNLSTILLPYQLCDFIRRNALRGQEGLEEYPSLLTARPHCKVSRYFIASSIRLADAVPIAVGRSCSIPAAEPLASFGHSSQLTRLHEPLLSMATGIHFPPIWLASDTRSSTCRDCPLPSITTGTKCLVWRNTDTPSWLLTCTCSSEPLSRVLYFEAWLGNRSQRAP